MLVYLRVDILDGCRTQRAFHTVTITPEYVWRYANYDEGVNFFRNYVHRYLMYNSGNRLTLGIL